MRIANREGLVTTSVAVWMALLCISSVAGVPEVLPDPDGKPGDPTRPVRVYILAGQSNMCGMGKISGAKNPYAGIYMMADPDAPLGDMHIGRTLYGVQKLGIYVSADPDAAKGATASVYQGAYDAAKDYTKRKPVRTETVALGTAKVTLPVSAGQTCVVTAFVQVPATGSFTVSAGCGDSAYNVTTLDGKEVYRRNPGEAAVRTKVNLEQGKRYPVTITCFKGGPAAFWLTQHDLQAHGDLELVTRRDKKFPWLIDDKGDWTVCNDVTFAEARVAEEGKWGPLSPTSSGSVGPELGFGYVVGYYHDAQVLLIKTAIGNRALGFDFRPPSSGRLHPESEWEGKEWDLMVKGVNMILGKIDKVVPGYKGQGYEMAGFVWWQGHKDSFSPELIAEYEKNLCNLINDVRKEFKAPTMPAVIATVGFHGYEMSDKFLQILMAQMAVGDPEKHPEYAGNVKTVDTRPFWREFDVSPSGVDYHYNLNAETYMLTGDALGRAMVEMEDEKGKQ